MRRRLFQYIDFARRRHHVGHPLEDSTSIRKPWLTLGKAASKSKKTAVGDTSHKEAVIMASSMSTTFDNKERYLIKLVLEEIIGSMCNLTALQMTRESAYTNTRTTFSGTAQEDRIQIALPPRTMIDDWPLQGSQIHDRMTIVKYHNLSIHR